MELTRIRCGLGDGRLGHRHGPVEILDIPRLAIPVTQADGQIGQRAEPVVLSWRADLDGLVEQV